MSRSRPPKIQRLIDLLAALLRRRFSATFEELTREVPAYADAPSRDAIVRMFERDKDELRSLGVRIQTVSDEDRQTAGYLLRRRDFYLPFIAVAPGGADDGLAAGRAGYRELQRVVIAPDELAALDDAALRVRRLGDPVLAADAEAAIRKLAFDLPPGTFVSTAPTTFVAGFAYTDARVFELLDQALRHRKRTAFTYRPPNGDGPGRRVVEPYALYFRDGHWHLVARDAARDRLHGFRLDRIDDLEVNERRQQSPDYEICPGFDLRGRETWPWALEPPTECQVQCL